MGAAVKSVTLRSLGRRAGNREQVKAETDGPGEKIEYYTTDKISRPIGVVTEEEVTTARNQ